MNGVLTGEFQNGKRVGKWTYNGKHNYEEIYDNGILVKRTAKQYDIKNKLDVVLSPTSHETEKFNFDKSVFKNLYSFFEAYPTQNMDSIQRSVAYPGGIKKLLSLIALNLKFPKEDRMKETQGRVIVSLTIDEHGNVKNRKIIKSLSSTYDEEALRVIKLFEDKLCPALLDGKPYEAILSIPIAFRLG
jgi:TonB family protein